MDRSSIARRIGRGLMVLALAVFGGLADFAGNGLCETRQWCGYCARHPRRCAGRSRHCVFNRARVLHSAAELLLSLCAAGLLRRASAGLFSPAAARCVLCSDAVLHARM
jgi:hypothetical protein